MIKIPAGPRLKYGWVVLLASHRRFGFIANSDSGSVVLSSDIRKTGERRKLPVNYTLLIRDASSVTS